MIVCGRVPCWGPPAGVTIFHNLGQPRARPLRRAGGQLRPGSKEGSLSGGPQTLGTLMLRRVSDPGGTPSISPNIPITVATTSSSIPIQHLGNTGGNNGRIDGLDDRLYAAHIRNGRLWTAHNIRVDATGVASSGAQSREAARWYEMNGIAARQWRCADVVQSGTVFDSAPTLATARALSVLHMVSGRGRRLGFTTAGALSHRCGDKRRLPRCPGTTQAVALSTASSTAYNPPRFRRAGGRRWGDYSYTSLDPADDLRSGPFKSTQRPEHVCCRVSQLLAPPPARPPLLCGRAYRQPSVHVVITGTPPEVGIL